MTKISWRADAAHICGLALPLIATQFAQVALSATDIAMMGLLGPLEIAAGGLALVVFNLLRTTGVGLITPVANLVAAGGESAQAESDVRSLVRAGFVIATLAGLAFWGLMLMAPGLLAWCKQDAAVLARTADYLRAAAPGMLPLLWFQTLRNVTVGLRRPGPMLGITLVSAVLNAGLDYALMFGVFGLPALGLTGIAWATTLVNLFAFAAFLLIVRCDPMLGRFLSMGMRRHDVRQAMRRILRMGWPVAGTYASEAGFFMVVALLAGAIGADALAAHTVVNQAVYMVFMISVGLSHAASISISKVWAQGDVRAARRYGAAGLGIGLACMAVVALAYLTAPHQVLRLFLHRDSAAVWSIAAQLMTIAAVLQFFDCGQNIGVGILRGTGETGSAFALTLIGYWGVGLPAAWLLGDVFGCGAPGIWIGLVLGLMAAAVMLLRRFHRLTARRLVVKRTQELLPAKRG